jgi:hypothetical protein
VTGEMTRQLPSRKVLTNGHLRASPQLSGLPVLVYTGSSKKNAGIIKTHHSKTVKHIKNIQVLKWRRKNISFGYAQLMVGNV